MWLQFLITGFQFFLVTLPVCFGPFQACQQTQKDAQINPPTHTLVLISLQFSALHLSYWQWGKNLFWSQKIGSSLMRCALCYGVTNSDDWAEWLGVIMNWILMWCTPMMAFATTFASVHQVSGCTLHEGPPGACRNLWPSDRHVKWSRIEKGDRSWLDRSDWVGRNPIQRDQKPNFP